MSSEIIVPAQIDYAASARGITEALPKKGAVAVFIPKDEFAIRRELIAGSAKPGIFRDFTSAGKERGVGELLTAEEQAYKEGWIAEQQRRFATPGALTAAQTMVENAKEPQEKLVAELSLLEVEASYAAAVMVEAARQYKEEQKNGTLTPERATWLKGLLNDAQDRIYPQLDATIAAGALHKIEHPKTESMLMSVECRQSWYEFLHAKYDPIMDDIFEQFDDDELINGEKLAAMARVFMEKTGLPMADADDDTTKWNVVYDPSRTSFMVTAATKTIYTGNRTVDLDRMGFEKLMMHEVVVHAWRAENGSRTGFPAFQKGLPGYLMYEEGFGILMESLWSGEDIDQLSRDHFRYAATAYADGVYDDVKHSEQETYNFTKQLMDAAGIEDDDELYRHVMRPFRGMPDDCRMRSNASYYAGKIEMATLLQVAYAAKRSVAEVFAWLSAGKTNPTDETQDRLLQEAHAAKDATYSSATLEKVL